MKYKEINYKVKSKLMYWLLTGIWHRAEDTYQTEPSEKFPSERASRIIKQTLEELVQNEMYDPNRATELVKVLADAIKQRIKGALRCQRYKLVSFVVVGPPDGISASMVSRCIWNEAHDTRAEAIYETNHILVVGLVYAIYMD